MNGSHQLLVVRQSFTVLDGIDTTGSDEVFFAFNPEKQQPIQQADGNTVAQFDITDLTDTFIVAEKEAHRISINRGSGTLIHRHQDNESTASCELSSQQKF